MLAPRLIPCLLVQNDKLVKTVKFCDPKYIGDPINAIKIFNEKEVDELILIDISATVEGSGPNFELIEQIASECFMPVCYGGGIRSIADIKKLFNLGIEKVSIGAYAVENPDFIKQASRVFGSQSIVVCIDVKRNLWGNPEVMYHRGTKKTGFDPITYACQMQDNGAGELLINTIDRDGTFSGYDIKLIQSITSAVKIPVIACGGAGTLENLAEVIRSGGASSAAAGSLFVFYGKYHAVLISYPSPDEITAILG